MSQLRPKSTLEQWRIFQAVVDFGGYAQASAKLNKSQSSLNHAVSKLQTMLGVQLLEVKGRKAFLTSAGKVMLRRSRQLTQNIEDLENLAINIKQSWEPEITLAADLAYPREELLPTLAEFLPRSRASRLKVIDTVLTGTEEAITQGWADIVISHNVPKGHLGEPLKEISFVLVSHPDHPLVQLPSPIDANELLQHLQLVIKDSSSSPAETHGWLKSEQRWTVSQFDSAIQLLQLNQGFCWLPHHKVKKYLDSGELVQLIVKGSSFKKYTMHLVHPKPDQLGPGTRLLSELILSRRQIDI